MGPLEFIYYLGYSFGKSRGLNNRKKLPVKVISVGNLTVGGTGKTPAVIAVAEEAGRRGLKPCILTRGYRGKAQGPCFVSRGEGALLGVDEAGDEALLMADRLKGVPVVKGIDRYEAGIFALGALGQAVSLFILDDGFQHWKLHRDRDILLLDCSNPFGNRRLLPMGILREPLKEMERADMIVITKVDRKSSGGGDANNLMSEIRRYNADAPIYISDHLLLSLITPSGAELSLDALSGKRIFAFCGIGSPSSFRQSLLTTKAHLNDFMAFGDHHAYAPKDIERIKKAAAESGADWIVTTEKDIIKLKNLEPLENLVALRIEFRPEEGFYEELFREE